MRLADMPAGLNQIRRRDQQEQTGAPRQGGRSTAFDAAVAHNMSQSVVIEVAESSGPWLGVLSF
jgi:hypothetical protein